MVLAVPLLLWVISQPLAGAVVLSSGIGLLVGVRRASRLIRCFSDCDGFAFDLGGRIRISIRQPHVDDVC